ncbi:acyl carrier protein [Streptomyces sp. NPDC001435]|uniref:acyl carrier protein n=1 Tax=unclassified Streptomyces TaxID=2593676 RepID=UPI0036C260E2
MLTTTDITATVHEQINALLKEAGKPVLLLTGDEPLARIGLNSLLLARLIIQLEMEFGADPFEEDYVISDVRTVGALADAYIETLANLAAATA